jgi:high-affinity nickel permease
MINFLSIIAIGFFLGMRHATDPDHVIAITTIVSKQNRIGRAALTGIFWGIGHTLTIFVVGTAIILFEVVIPARIGLSMEFSVALMLLVLGLMNLAAFLRASKSIAEVEAGWNLASPDEDANSSFARHSHSHDHTHHPHSMGKTLVANTDRVLGKLRISRQLRPLLIGIVHGLAGSAAVALLVLTTIRNPRWAIAYLLVFGLGTVAGMVLITMSIASALNFVGRRHATFTVKLGLVSGLISLAFGLLLVYQIVFAGGLFSAHPQWTPH